MCYGVMKLRFLGIFVITVGEQGAQHSIKLWADEHNIPRARWRDLNDIRSAHGEQTSHHPLRGRTFTVEPHAGFTNKEVEIHRIETRYHRRGKPTKT